MPNRPWKAEERRAAALFGARRFRANTGGALDFETAEYMGQVKHVQRLSERAAEGHRSLRVTPAMAAGITDRMWDLNELLAI